MRITQRQVDERCAVFRVAVRVIGGNLSSAQREFVVEEILLKKIRVSAKGMRAGQAAGVDRCECVLLT